MTDRAVIAALESRLVNAWPSFEVELADGWLLRFAEGYSKRANSATAIVPGARLDPDLLAHIRRSFDERGLPVCVRLTGLEDDGCDAVLAGAGLVSHDPSLVMVAGLDASHVRDAAMVVRPVAKPSWIAAAAAAYGGHKADGEKLGRIVRLIRQPAAFATLLLDGEAAAFGFAVAERGYVGLYDIVVAPNLRGLGLGRRLVAGLMAWGREAGATRAYLQMREANEVAHGLYRSLGFATAYRYTQRVPEEGAGRVARTAPAAISRQARASDALGEA